MKTASAYNERAGTRSAHKVAEKIARNAGVDFEQWIDEAIAEYADDLGVAPDELNERERLEAIEERIDRHARATPARRAPSRSRREFAAESPDLDPEAPLRHRRTEAAPARPRRESAPDPDESEEWNRPRSRQVDDSRESRAQGAGGRLERAILDIERRAERNEERTARALDSLTEVVKTRGGERNRLEQSVADIEKRAQRNEERTASAIEALQGLVESRGGERVRLEQAVAEVEARAQRNAERTAKALEGLSRVVAERDDERERLESAIARANRRSEESEARAAHALESMAHLVAEPAEPQPRRRERADPLAARFDQLSRRAATGAPDDDEDESIRLVTERLAKRRRQRDDAPAAPISADVSVTLGGLRRDLRHLSDKVDHLSSATVSGPAVTAFRAQTRDVERALTAAADKVANAERTQGKVAVLLERVERLATAQPASAELAHALNALADAHANVDRDGPVAALKAVERQLSDLGARVETAARRPPHEARAIDDLARRIESLRTAVERQADVRPDAGEIASVLSVFNEKLDQAAVAGTQSAASLTTLAEMVARLEDEVRRPSAIDPRPIDDLTRRIEDMRDEIEKQGRLAPKVDDIHSALADLARKMERPSASTDDMSRLEESLADIRARFEETAARPAPVAFDMSPFEDLARRIEAMRGEIEKQGRQAPKFDDLRTALNEIARRMERTGASTKEVSRIEEGLADIRARLDRPAPSPQIEAVEATLRRLAARLEESAARPQTVALDSKPIEDLARRIESVRASLERSPTLAPQVERLELALGKVVDKLDRAATIDPNGLNTALSEMNRRLEETFRRRPEMGRESIEALAAQVDAVQKAIEKLERPSVGASDFAALANAVKALAGKIERGPGYDTSRLEAALADLTARLDRPGAASPAVKPLADAVAALGEKIDRMKPDDLAALSATMTAVARKMDRVEDIAFRDAHLENLVHEIVDRLTGIEGRIDSGAGAGAAAGWSPVEAAIRELNLKIADIRAASDTRAVEQDVRALHEKVDDLADQRRSTRFVEDTAQAVARELGGRSGGGDVIGHLLDIQERLDRLTAMRPTPATLELALGDFAEQMDALRANNDAAKRDGATVSDLRAEQAAFDRRLDARFSGVQDVLEKLVDRMARLEREIAAEQRASGLAPPLAPPGLAMPDIPDRDPVLRAPTPEAPRVSSLPRQREEVTGKTAAINAHIAAARRAATAAADGGASGENRKGEGLAQRAQAMLASNSRPVLLGAAGALTLLTGVAVYEIRNHAPMRRSSLELPAAAMTPLADVSPGVDDTPTGALPGAPQVIMSPIPAPSASPAARPPQALLSAFPAGFDGTLSSAAAKGDFGAEIEIAQRYLEGRTVSRDAKAASEWLQVAADGGSAFANYRLGALYEKGVGVTRDLAKARALYTKAAEAGNARAMHNLAVLYAQDGGQGKPDYVAALDWFRRAGANGVRDSQFNLGVLYGRGLGAKQDLAQSWLWFSLAARQGDSDAAHKRDEVSIRMDGRSMADAKKALDDFKMLTPNPAVNDPPRAPSAAADAASDAAKPADGKSGDAKPSEAKPGARI